MQEIVSLIKTNSTPPHQRPQLISIIFEHAKGIVLIRIQNSKSMSIFMYNTSMPEDIPDIVKKYFWGDDLSELNWEKHKLYIIETLLNKADKSALKWLFQQISPQEIQKMLPSLKLSTKSLNFWQIYLS